MCGVIEFKIAQITPTSIYITLFMVRKERDEYLLFYQVTIHEGRR